MRWTSKIHAVVSHLARTLVRMSGRHVPFSMRHDPDAAVKRQEVLYAGIPEHLRSSFTAFLDATTKYDNDLREIEQDLEVVGYSAAGLIVEGTYNSPDLGLDLVHERLCRTNKADTRGHAARDLARALIAGGSAYEVIETDHGYYALAERVDPTTRAAAEQAMSHGRSGDYLRLAWSELYGRGSNPTDAYGHAVKAVEAAALPVVAPNQQEGTLSDVVTALRTAPEGKYQVVLSGKHDAADPVNVVRLMTQLLWTHDHARHGTSDDSKPMTISRQEVEAAVHLAVVLVQWFESGAIRMA